MTRRTAYISLCLTCLTWPYAIELRAQIVTPVLDGTVHQIVEVDGRLWIATDSGAFQVNGGYADPVLEGRAVKNITEVDNRVWLGTSTGIVEIGKNGGTYTERLRELSIETVRVAGGRVWVGTHRNLLFFDDVQGGEPVSMFPDDHDDTVVVIEEIDQKIWVGSKNNVYTVEEDTPKKLFSADDHNRLIHQITTVSGYVWMVGQSSLYRRKRDSLETPGECVVRFQGKRRVAVFHITEVNGDIWLGTDKGVLGLRSIDSESSVLNAYRPSALTAANELNREKINVISLIDGDAWIGTTNRAYRSSVSNIHFYQHPQKSSRLNFKGFLKTRNEVWLWGPQGAFLFDADARYIVQLASYFDIIPTRVRINKVDLVRNGKVDPIGQDLSYYAAIHTSHKDLSAAKAEDGFSPISEIDKPVGGGIQDLHIAIKDAHGNVVDADPQTVFVIPGGIWIRIVVVPLLWIGVVFVLFSFAPYWRPLMALIMRPRFRGSLSLSTISVKLCFARGRRYLLKRYLKNLYKWTILMDWPKFDGWNVIDRRRNSSVEKMKILDEMLDDQRIILVGGKSSGECIKHLVWLILQPNTSLKKFPYMPVYLRVEDFLDSGDSLQEAAILQIENFGEVSDRDLASEFLRLGGFVFLLDGAGCSDGAGMARSAMRFISAYSQNNIVVLGIGEEVEGLDFFPTRLDAVHRPTVPQSVFRIPDEAAHSRYSDG